MFKKGLYETYSGHTAIIAQIRPVGQNSWILRGAIKESDVWHIHTWDINGKNMIGHPMLDLLEKK